MTDELIQAAIHIRKRAYAPYSKFLVGAALRCEGVVYAGCNVENAAYPLGSCAEAGAISAMVAGGGRQIEEIVIVGNGDVACTPCGGCRQRLREFGRPDLVVRMVSESGETKLVRTLGALLPDAFGPENLA
ncbi:cytidine deaminase [Kozakia baliensis]|uniref:Cytidine deaminase n=1 Tax=Kozakia baliensis TaxID=153496 RepID=A0A1D8US53_9PROT|nr:cytidine deaminase [Kozakia baliensis]AOX16446.1 cytidine deaminase [Kozakia baliensis]AOX19406.1 cytidine deaminase [Kozakia baliensis]GBR29020.1 cytidine deaminase [Kozakia baliensis NRIC 0488]GEL63473.1 cytidine deaminase [Kozakia baliensis]